MRFLLKIILQRLSALVIKKHDIEFVIISGWLGEEIVKEGIYTLLSDKFVTRRNIKPFWWDFSLPLNILGYEDRKRNILEWFGLIIRVIFLIFISPRNKHILVLSAQSQLPETANYWSSVISPKILVVVNDIERSPVTSKLIEVTKKAKGKIIIPQKYEKNAPKSLRLSFGIKDCDILVKSTEKTHNLSYSGTSLKYKNYHIAPHEKDILACIFGAALKMGLSVDDIISGLSKFDYRNLLLQKITRTING